MDSPESFSILVQTVEGYPMAAGGLCTKGYADFWKERFSLLSNLVFYNSDIFLLDYIIADSIKTLASPSLLAAGCSVKARSLRKSNMTSGGVIGLIQEDISSAEDTIYTVDSRFTVGNFSGGPGFVLFGSESAPTVKKDEVTPVFSEDDDICMLESLSELGAECGIVVSDGSGASAKGCLFVFDEKHREMLYL